MLNEYQAAFEPGATVPASRSLLPPALALEKPRKNPGRVMLANVVPPVVAVMLAVGAAVGESASGWSGSMEEETDARFASMSVSECLEGGGVVVMRSREVYAAKE